MSIAMERFGSEGHFPTLPEIRRMTPPNRIFQLQCRQCGYEPANVVTAPRACPKCGCTCFERFVRTGSTLAHELEYEPTMIQ